MQSVFIVLFGFNSGSCSLTSCFCSTGGWALNLKELKLIQTIGKGEFGGRFHTGLSTTIRFKSSLFQILLTDKIILMNHLIIISSSLTEMQSTAHFSAPRSSKKISPVSSFLR